RVERLDARGVEQFAFDDHRQLSSRGGESAMSAYDQRQNPRRRFLVRALAGGSALALAGCEKLSRSEWFPKILESAESVTRSAQRLLLPRKAMAEEFTDADRSPYFRSNGTAMPRNPQYMAMAAGGFETYRLDV